MCANSRRGGASITDKRCYQLWQEHRHNLCERWQDCQTFLDESGVRDVARKTLQPIREDEPIGPGNYKWTGWIVPNDQKGRVLSYKGKSGNLRYWGEHLGVSREMMRKLVDKHGTIAAVMRYRKARGLTVVE